MAIRPFLLPVALAARNPVVLKGQFASLIAYPPDAFYSFSSRRSVARFEN